MGLMGWCQVFLEPLSCDLNILTGQLVSTIIENYVFDGAVDEITNLLRLVCCVVEVFAAHKHQERAVIHRSGIVAGRDS